MKYDQCFQCWDVWCNMYTETNFSQGMTVYKILSYISGHPNVLTENNYVIIYTWLILLSILLEPVFFIFWQMWAIKILKFIVCVRRLSENMTYINIRGNYPKAKILSSIEDPSFGHHLLQMLINKKMLCQRMQDRSESSKTERARDVTACLKTEVFM